MDKTPFIGRLDTMVTLMRNTLVQGSGGASVPTVVEICKTYASCESDTGNMVADEKVHHVVKSVFVIRFRPGVLGVAELELAADGQKYKVTHVEKIRRSHLRLHCTDPDAWGETDNGGGENPGGGGSLPVILNSPNAYGTAGTMFTLQMQTSAGVTGYGVLNIIEGLNLDEETGVISGILNDYLGVRSMTLQATNEYGTTSKLIFLHTVDYDMSVIQPPQNLEITEYNVIGASFLVQYEILRFNPGYERLEMFINDEFYREFIHGMPYAIEPGVRADLMQKVPPFPRLTDMYFKARLKGNDGNYSEFSEVLYVNIPMP